MFDDITIVIPTQGRLDKQQTLDILSPALLSRTILMVEPHEYDDHDIFHGNKVEVHKIPHNVNGIAEIRQYAVERCATDFLFLIDDDMVFFKRQKDSVKLDKCTHQQQEDMFNELIDWMYLEEFPLVGLSARQGNNHIKEPYRDATRQMNFHGVHIPLFKRYRLAFNGLKVMEDFNLVLSMLTQGIPNRVMYHYCWNQLGSGLKGGCSLYRTGELQRACALELQRRFPDFVKVVEKKSKGGWEGLEVRTDVRVQWKKAYEFGVSKK